MVANLLKYLTIRIFFAFILFLISSFASMYILYENMGGERYNPVMGLIITALSLFIPSVFLSFIGKLRFEGFLTKAKEYDLSQNPKTVVKLFERLLHFASSFYFFPTTTEKLLKQAYWEYSKLYMGFHAGVQAAQEVYEETILRFPGDKSLQKMLLDIYAEKDILTKKELGVCVLILKHSPLNEMVIEILSKHYIKNNIFDFDSQKILSRAINLNIPSKEKIMDFLILKLIELNRKDDFAAEVYLEAYSSYSNKRETVAEEIIKLTFDRQEKGKTDAISKRIFQVYEKLPETTKKRIEEQIVKIRQEKERLLATPRQSIKKWFIKLLYKSLDVVEAAKNSFKNRIPKLKTFTTPKVSFIKKSPVVIFSGFSLVLVALLSIMVLNGGKNKKPSLDLLDINPSYTTYGSKLPFSIQVAAFKNLLGAEKAINELSNKGEKAYYTKSRGKNVWYRVRVGEFNTRNQAKQYAEKLLKSKIIRGYFITNFEQGFLKINKDVR